MVVDRAAGTVEHKHFRDLADYFAGGDCLVVNTSKVMPVRVFGKKITGGRVELLFVDLPAEKRGTSADTLKLRALVRPSVADGTKISFADGSEAVAGARVAVDGEFDGAREIIFRHSESGVGTIESFIESHGVMPLPPYIKRKNADAKTVENDRIRYQTVYADKNGSVAAPTAGLHFTRESLEGLRKRGVTVAKIVLHVGLGTFKSVKADRIDKHKMLPERFFLSQESADEINGALKSGATIAAAGTTSVRTLETLASDDGSISAGSGETSLFIYPGYRFKTVGRLLTNFHLPRSTPLFLASAFCGRELLFEAYRKAIKERYRFFSYGDAMLIV